MFICNWWATNSTKNKKTKLCGPTSPTCSQVPPEAVASDSHLPVWCGPLHLQVWPLFSSLPLPTDGLSLPLNNKPRLTQLPAAAASLLRTGANCLKALSAPIPLQAPASGSPPLLEHKHLAWALVQVSTSHFAPAALGDRVPLEISPSPVSLTRLSWVSPAWAHSGHCF